MAKTVAALKDINPDYVIRIHCPGMNMIMAVNMAMPKTLVMPSTGTRVVFGSRGRSHLRLAKERLREYRRDPSRARPW